MNESTFEILATASLESRVQHMSDRILDTAVSRVENECLFNNGVKYERKKMYEMEVAKIILERAIEKADEKLNNMYAKEDQK